MNEAWLMPLYARLEEMLASQDRVILAIDGPCAGGKTTLAAQLAEKYGGTVFHMDDFFLRPEQRTPERYAEPGGNVDRERFAEEILIPLKQGREVSFRRFDCGTFSLTEPVIVRTKHLVIVEGAYSLHPALREAYDLRVFLSVGSALQMQRILHRNGEAGAARFCERWIPLEQRYFAAFDPKGCCQIVLSAEE